MAITLKSKAELARMRSAGRIVAEVLALVEEGKSISAVARTFNVHPATIYRVLDG